jgi:acetate kinase
MSDALLVLNAGSSSVKFSLFTDERRPRPIARGQIEAIETRPRLTARGEDGFLLERSWPEGTRLGHEGAIHTLLDWAPEALLGARSLVAVGHRVVHGGAIYTEPVVVDAAVLQGLRALVPLAPLHQPHSLAAIAAVAQRIPGVPQVACFDTAFHRTQPALGQMFALPRRYFDEGVRR